MKTAHIHSIYKDSKISAQKAGLIVYDQSIPGFSRHKKGKKEFEYRNEKGNLIRDKKTIERINSLAIPPAWKEVTIAKSPRGHIQATGIDSKGNKQYIYHEKWSEFRETLKFDRLLDFAHELPKLRKVMYTELHKPGLSREKVIAAVLELMDKLSIRIGNEQYAENNKTYGLTTMKDKHVSITKDHIELHFVGKSHQEHDLELQNKTLAKVVKASRDIPGDHLFQYLDEANKKHPITSTEVNTFIKQIIGEHFTAKDFRMWAATSHAYSLMKEECKETLDEKGTKKSLKKVITCVAEKLGNTPAVCKAHYIHGDLQTEFANGSFAHAMKKLKKSRATRYMKGDELELQLFLKKFRI